MPRGAAFFGRSALAPAGSFRLAVSTAYSDSHADLPFLEAGHPVTVNPGRELRRIAAERGWQVLEFRRRAA